MKRQHKAVLSALVFVDLFIVTTFSALVWPLYPHPAWIAAATGGVLVLVALAAFNHMVLREVRRQLRQGKKC